MKKRGNLVILCLVVITIAGSGILYKNYFTNIDSNSYLSSKDESERSIFCHEDNKSSKNTHSFDFKKFDGKWSLMEFTSSKGKR